MAAYVPGSFDCLITDVRMPGHSGLDLLQHLRSIGSAMPAIVITADINPATRSRAMRYGAYAYLTKPIETGALLRYLQSAVRLTGFRSDAE